MKSINQIQKRSSSKRKLADDLLQLAAGLRMKNNYSNLPRVHINHLDDGYAVIDCGEMTGRSAYIASCILNSEDLHGFLDANRKFKPRAEHTLRHVGKTTKVVSCVRIEFQIEEGING